jgi:hypothetical protein
MARLFNDAASEYLEISSAVITAVPLTIACWFRSDDLSIDQALVTVAASGSGHHFGLYLRGNQANDPVAAFTNGGGNAISQTGTTTVNTWTHGAAVFSANNNRLAYHSGVAGTADTASQTPASVNRTAIGRRSTSSPGVYTSGRLAEVGIWNIALAANDVLALATGVLPYRIRPEACVGYWPIWGLHSPEIDLCGVPTSMTVTGTAQADHAPVNLFSLYTPSFAPQVVAAASSHRLALLGVGL